MSILLQLQSPAGGGSANGTEQVYALYYGSVTGYCAHRSCATFPFVCWHFPLYVYEVASIDRMDVSWTMLYVIVCAPGVLLLANFTFGSCTIAEGLEYRVEGKPTARREHRVVGRCALVGVLLCTAWQYWECMFALRWWEGREALMCNPILAAYLLVDLASGWLVGAPERGTTWGSVLQCTEWEVSYLVTLAAVVVLMWRCVVMRSHVAAPGPHTSFCRKCMCHVQDMDHHCYFLHNCIGQKNRVAFVQLMISTCTLAGLVLARCPLGFVAHSLRSIVGYLTTLIIFCGTLCLGVLQVALLRKGMTTIQFLKQRRKDSWLRSMLDLL